MQALRGESFTAIWMLWFIADFLGILLVGGLLCAWANERVGRSTSFRARMLHGAAAVGMLLYTCWVFLPEGGTEAWGIRRPWTIVVIAQFLVFFAGPRFTLTTVFLSSVLAMALTFNGHGPFVGHAVNQGRSLWDLQTFLGGLATATLLFGAAVAERRSALDRLQRKLRLVERERARTARYAAQLQANSKQLELAKRAAEEASVAKSSFLANMSHEIRTPLTSILGFTEMLKEESLTSDGAAAVETIYRNGDHLLGLLNDLLDLSRIESGKLELEFQPLDPRVVVADVADLLRARAKEKGIALEATVAHAVPALIWSDALRLRQAFLNLGSNAVKFTRRGSVKLALQEVHVADCASRTLCFSVTDTGVGLQAEQLEKIFDPFVQADPSTTRKYGGSGLGLAITKRIAESLEGGIDVESWPDRGSTFRFYFVADRPVDAGPPAFAGGGLSVN